MRLRAKLALGDVTTSTTSASCLSSFTVSFGATGRAIINRTLNRLFMYLAAACCCTNIYEDYHLVIKILLSVLTNIQRHSAFYLYLFEVASDEICRWLLSSYLYTQCHLPLMLCLWTVWRIFLGPGIIRLLVCQALAVLRGNTEDHGVLRCKRLLYLPSAWLTPVCLEKSLQ